LSFGRKKSEGGGKRGRGCGQTRHRVGNWRNSTDDDAWGGRDKKNASKRKKTKRNVAIGRREKQAKKRLTR